MMEDSEKKDIFTGSRFDEEKQPEPETKSFKSGFSSLVDGIVQILKGLWYIFTKRFPMNLFFLLLIMGLVLVGGYFLWNQEKESAVQINFPEGVDISGLEVDNIETILAEKCLTQDLETTLVDISCPECELCTECSQEECPECPEIDCEDEAVNVIYYQCLDGNIVKDKTECNELPMGLKTNDYKISNGIMLALNNVEYEILDEDEYYGKINMINVSIYNQANNYIRPKLRVYFYKTWVEDDPYKKSIDFDGKTVHPNAGITWTEESNIKFLKQQETMRLVLLDTVPDPDEEIVSLTKTFDFS